MDNPTLTGTPPRALPAMVINGRTLTLKSSLLAEFILDKRGVDTKSDAIIATLRSERPGRTSLILELFAAFVAHNYVERGETAPTPEQWCLLLGPDLLKEAAEKLVAALFPNLPTSPQAGEGDDAKKDQAIQ